MNDAATVTAAAAELQAHLRHVHALLAEACEQQGSYGAPAHTVASCVLPALSELADCVALLAGPAPSADAGPWFLGRDEA